MNIKSFSPGVQTDLFMCLSAKGFKVLPNIKVKIVQKTKKQLFGGSK